MTADQVIDALLELLRIATAWPIILLAIFFLFRKELRRVLPKLASSLAARLRKASIGQSSFEFAEVEEEALRDTIREHADELKEDPTQFADFVARQVKKIAIAPARPELDALPLKGRRILWVDDNPSNNAYEANLFRRMGADVVFEESTTAGLARRNRERFDLIISDVSRMEGGRRRPQAGYELLAQNEQREPYVPVILYTSNVRRIDPVAAAPAVGVSDTPAELTRLVLETIGES